MRRSDAGVEAMASIAFIKRLRRICCTCTGSPKVAGKLASKSVSRLTLRAINSLLSNESVDLIRSFTSIVSKLFSPFFKQAAQALDNLSGSVVFVHDVL